MPDQETIILPCPYCQGELDQPLAWFKQTYFTCPHCQGGLTTTQFETLLQEIEAAFDASIEEMLVGRGDHGCGCGSGGCGHGQPE